MNKILLTILACLFSAAMFGQADAIDTYFNKYQEDDNFTVVYISPRMFQMVTKVTEGTSDSDMQELKDVIKDVRGLKILTTETTPQAYYKEAIKTIPTSSYEVLMTVKDDESNVRFLTKGNNPDIVEELLLIVGSPDSFVLMSFVGKLNLDKIGKLANQLDIEGAEHFKKLENKE